MDLCANCGKPREGNLSRIAYVYDDQHARPSDRTCAVADAPLCGTCGRDGFKHLKRQFGLRIFSFIARSVLRLRKPNGVTP